MSDDRFDLTMLLVAVVALYAVFVEWTATHWLGQSKGMSGPAIVGLVAVWVWLAYRRIEQAESTPRSSEARGGPLRETRLQPLFSRRRCCCRSCCCTVGGRWSSSPLVSGSRFAFGAAANQAHHVRIRGLTIAEADKAP